MRFISAPFGNYLAFEGWISTAGTFTAKYRGGLLKRMERAAKTLRWDGEGWINKMGLPNPGGAWMLKNGKKMRGKLVSIGVANDDTEEEFRRLLDQCVELAGKEKIFGFELNLSCPNCDRSLYDDQVLAMAEERLGGQNVYLKLPPQGYEKFVGASQFKKYHVSNTWPTERGGKSGPILIPHTLGAIEYIRENQPEAEIVAGGGVGGPDVAGQYLAAGADHIAVGSGWFNFFNWKNIKAIKNGTS